MFLILYNKQDISTVSFIEFLKSKNCTNYCHLEISNIINNLAIKDNFKSNCVWNINNTIVDFKNLSGIYNRIHEINNEYFSDYIEEDRDYVSKEWWSYLVYRLNLHPNIINPVTFEYYSGNIWQFPFCFKKAKEFGFNIPEYYFSTKYEELEKIFSSSDKKYIAKHSLFNITNFRESETMPQNTVALVEFIKGNLLFVHVVDTELYPCLWVNENKVDYKLSIQEKEQCLALIHNLNMKVCQLVFVITENTKFLFSLSPYPNWLHNHKYLEIYAYLHEILQK